MYLNVISWKYNQISEDNMSKKCYLLILTLDLFSVGDFDCWKVATAVVFFSVSICFECYVVFENSDLFLQLKSL